MTITERHDRGTQAGSELARVAKVGPDPLGIEFYIIRHLDAGVMRGQLVQPQDDPPEEEHNDVVGPFVRLYPPPLVQYACFLGCLKQLLNVETDLPIPDNPTNSDEEKAFAAAIAREALILKENGYPVMVIRYRGHLTPIKPLWGVQPVLWQEHLATMSEGTQAG